MKKALLCTFFLFGFATNALAAIQTVPQVDLPHFAGTWYEIARNPIVFEPKCACARQVLTPREDGKIDVYNSCNRDVASGPLTEIRGTASATDASGAKLAVDFGFPWKGDYWIIANDTQSHYAVVTDRFGYSLYILARTPVLESSVYEAAVHAAEAQVGVKRLVMTPQVNCQYPAIR